MEQLDFGRFTGTTRGYAVSIIFTAARSFIALAQQACTLPAEREQVSPGEQVTPSAVSC